MNKNSVYQEESLRATVEGRILDVEKSEFFEGKIHIDNGIIVRVERCSVQETQVILPGFIDSHIHIESSMLLPTEFAREAVRHGMVAVVADPHEIANVAGMDGVYYMLDNAQQSGFKFYFSAPSCVPATPFDPAGAVLGAEEVGALLADPRISHLGEMMNYPGVLANDPEVMAKLNFAKHYGKPIDGHVPGLSGEDLRKYVESGISTDHETVDICEAEEKISLGMKILIREGSAAKSFDLLYPLVNRYPSRIMFCTDDCHPDDLLKGSINLLVKRGIEKGLNIFNLIQAACVNPVLHYNLDVGLLREGDRADMIVVDSIENLSIQKTFINGILAYNAPDQVFLPSVTAEPINRFNALPITQEAITIEAAKGGKIRVIGVLDKNLYTESLTEEPTVTDGKVVADVERDILKIVVLNRYHPSKPAVGFVKNVVLKQGAICSSVSHDSHNIIAIGVEDEHIVDLVNMIVDAKGGIGVHDGKSASVFSLPIAGLMSSTNAESAAAAYEFIQNKALALGTTLTSPFMTMAFLSLIVIPDLKISSSGLFDVTRFKEVDLFV